jgi:basic amino acid/polyamine antiporter, APA family
VIESIPPAQRRLGLVAATALVVANMIGTGVFTTTGFLSADLGGAVPVLIGWLVGGVLALCGAAVYAELGAMMPRVGGEYVYLRRAFHPLVGFLSGWISLVVGFSAPIAASAVAFGKYTSAVFPALSGTVAAVGVIVAMTLLHMSSVALGSTVQTVFTALKVLLILVFIVAGALVGDGDWSNVTSTGAGADAVLSSTFAVSLIWISFSYSGWNAAAYVAGEIRDPERNLPRALLIGTGIVTALYLLLNVIFFYAAPAEVLGGAAGGGPAVEVGDVAARRLFGDSAGRLLSSLIAIALVSSVSAMVMAGPRVYTAMAEDGIFFQALAKRGQGGAPVLGVLLQGALAVFLVLIAKFDQLLTYIGFTLSVFAALTVLGAFVLRAREPDTERPYRTFGWPVTPLLFLVLSVWMAFHSIRVRPTESLYGLATLVAGVVVYLLWARFGGRKPR